MLILQVGRRAYRFDVGTTQRIEIGRHHVAQIRLAEADVSVHHADVVSEQDLLVLRDLGSTNGTRLNGNRVRQSVLKLGDRIEIGSTTIHVAGVSQRQPKAGHPLTDDQASAL